MKKTLMLLLCCGIFQANAATNVSGIISSNTTWTKANSPYIVNGDLSVDSAVTLTIEPGVTVRVDKNYFFYVDGKIIAEGTLTDSILFMANTVSDSTFYAQWEGIKLRIKGKNDTCRFKYCRFEYATNAVYTEGPGLYISYSVFRHNGTGIAVNVFSSSTNCYFNISKCLLTENGKGVYHYSSHAKGELTENEISYNVVGCEDNSYKGLKAQYNSFDYNEQGLALSGYQQLPDIRFNTFKGNSYTGMNFRNSPTGTPGYSRTVVAPISDNLFIYNTTALQIWDIDICTVTNNSFAYNLVGIDRSSPASATPFYPANMVISNNCLTNNANYNLQENFKADFSVPNNWWGTTSTAGIDSGIYDYYDNFSSGKISYTPILTNNSGCQPVSAPPPCLQVASVNATATSLTTATVTWPAVTGALGYEYYVDFINSAPQLSGRITTGTSLSLTGLVPESTYRVCVRTKCVAAPFVFTWVCDTFATTATAIPKTSADRAISIYPNPSSGTFNISLSKHSADAAVIVYDMAGRVVTSKQMNTANETISMGNAAKGIYTVRIITDNAVLNERIVVE